MPANLNRRCKKQPGEPVHRVLSELAPADTDQLVTFLQETRGCRASNLDTLHCDAAHGLTCICECETCAGGGIDFGVCENEPEPTWSRPTFPLIHALCVLHPNGACSQSLSGG